MKGDVSVTAIIMIHSALEETVFISLRTDYGFDVFRLFGQIESFTGTKSKGQRVI